MHSAPAADGEITQLLRQWSDGHDDAFRELLSVAYDRLRLMARASMRRERPDHTLEPTALVAELYLRLAGAKLAGWKDREHFYSFCARAMRWILTDHARKRAREAPDRADSAVYDGHPMARGAGRRCLRSGSRVVAPGGNRFPQGEDRGIARLPGLHGGRNRGHPQLIQSHG